MSPFHQNTIKKTPIFKKNPMESDYSNSHTHRSPERVGKKSVSPKSIGEPKMVRKESSGFISSRSKPLGSLREKNPYGKWLI